MGFFDRSDRRRSSQEAGPTAGAAHPDPHALGRYEQLLGSAPPATIESVHVEAFERLTPAERDAVFERLTSGAASAGERPAAASPAALARSASRAEAWQRGAVARLLGVGPAGVELSAAVAAAILGTVAAYAASSAVWAAWAAEGDEDGYAGPTGVGGFDF